MQEVVPPLLTLVVGFALGHLVLMVRKCQVDAPGVNVQLASKHRTGREHTTYDITSYGRLLVRSPGSYPSS